MLAFVPMHYALYMYNADKATDIRRHQHLCSCNLYLTIYAITYSKLYFFINLK